MTDAARPDAAVGRAVSRSSPLDLLRAARVADVHVSVVDEQRRRRALRASGASSGSFLRDADRLTCALLLGWVRRAGPLRSVLLARHRLQPTHRCRATPMACGGGPRILERAAGRRSAHRSPRGRRRPGRVADGGARRRAYHEPCARPRRAVPALTPLAVNAAVHRPLPCVRAEALQLAQRAAPLQYGALVGEQGRPRAPAPDRRRRHGRRSEWRCCRRRRSVRRSTAERGLHCEAVSRSRTMLVGKRKCCRRSRSRRRCRCCAMFANRGARRADLAARLVRSARLSGS